MGAPLPDATSTCDDDKENDCLPWETFPIFDSWPLKGERWLEGALIVAQGSWERHTTHSQWAYRIVFGDLKIKYEINNIKAKILNSNQIDEEDEENESKVKSPCHRRYWCPNFWWGRVQSARYVRAPNAAIRWPSFHLYCYCWRLRQPSLVWDWRWDSWPNHRANISIE